uniref:MARVEL domain-containing protein n=1 Tax=Parastrongyloides trichosuri TaxID=131310 RepID=A0A0N4ZUH5_PARTI
MYRERTFPEQNYFQRTQYNDGRNIRKSKIHTTIKEKNSTYLCCCSIKDGSMTVAIWSGIYALCCLFLFGWQTGVLSQCNEVTMAQSNLKCEYYCPCVGASTARTSRIIEGLFIIQILCLIVAFFLLFASLGLVYGIHTGARYLIWPWFPCIISSVLTSVAYCIMWWVGDVRDYWLAITICLIILQFVNGYCFVVIIVYYGKLQSGGRFKDKYIGGQMITNDNEDEYEEEIRDYDIQKSIAKSDEVRPHLKYYNNEQFITDEQIRKENLIKKRGAYDNYKDIRNSVNTTTTCRCRKCSKKINHEKSRNIRHKNCCENNSYDGTDISSCDNISYHYKCNHKSSKKCSYCHNKRRKTGRKKSKRSHGYYSTTPRQLYHSGNSKNKTRNYLSEKSDKIMMPQNIYIPKTGGDHYDEEGKPIKNKYIIDSEYTFNC